jgi:hypothetical protein
LTIAAGLSDIFENMHRLCRYDLIPRKHRF